MDGGDEYDAQDDRQDRRGEVVQHRAQTHLTCNKYFSVMKLFGNKYFRQLKCTSLFSLFANIFVANIFVSSTFDAPPERDRSRDPTAVMREGTIRGRISAFSIRRKISPT